MSNKVIKATVTVNFETTSGYEARTGWQNKPGTEALEAGLREIVRVMTINGDKQRVAEIVGECTAAVEADMKS